MTGNGKFIPTLYIYGDIGGSFIFTHIKHEILSARFPIFHGEIPDLFLGQFPVFVCRWRTILYSEFSDSTLW